MKYLLLTAMLSFVFCVFAPNCTAVPTRIVSGELFFGGSAYNTPDYQTYTRFFLTVKQKNPQRIYEMFAEQPLSVYLEHPVQLEGDFQYLVKIPYGPQGMRINGELFSPVWYEGCSWLIESSAQTPVVSASSPQFVYVYSQFRMSGNIDTFGAVKTVFKVNGYGTAEFKFEKIDTKYYIREARYTFSNNQSNNPANQPKLKDFLSIY